MENLEYLGEFYSPVTKEQAEQQLALLIDGDNTRSFRIFALHFALRFGSLGPDAHRAYQRQLDAELAE